MKIHSLKVRGAIGFKKGLGLDEISVDFAGLSGLVALAGPNGHGKTTLLENISPYRMFASRAGALRNHFFLRDSFRDLTFEYGGDQFRTLVKIDSESDRTEGFVWKNGESMVDGKVTNYTRYIEDLLGSSNLFYNSVFCAQNSDKMSDMTTGDLKKLFVEFLRLDRLARYETAAKQCCNILNGSSQQLQRTLEGLQGRIARFQGIEDQMKKADDDIFFLQRELDSVTDAISTGQSEIARLTDIEAKNSVNIERRKDIESDIKALRDERTLRYHDNSDVQESLNRDLIGKVAGRLAANKILEQKDAILKASDRAKVLEEELSNARECDGKLGQSLENLYEKMEAKGKDIQGLRDEINRVENNPSRQDIDEQAQKLNESLKTIQGSIDILIRERSEAKQSFDLVRIDSEMKTCRESMALLDQRGDCPVEDPKCAFVLSALKAKDRLMNIEAERKAVVDGIRETVADIDARGKALRAEYNDLYLRIKELAFIDNNLKTKDEQAIGEIKARISEFEADQVNIRSSITDLQKRRQEKRESMDRLKMKLGQTQELAKQLPDIQQAQSRVEQLENVIHDLESTIQEKTDQYNQYERQAAGKLREMEQRLDGIKALIDEDAPRKLADARASATSSEQKKENLVKSIKSEDERIAVLKQRLEEKVSVEKEIDAAQAELGRIMAESAQWRYLQNACGKTGLQALEIDGVAPLITGYANDLLTSTFGPNFSVRLVTQDPETGKEVLDIVVIRGDGSETHLENLSGGEKVWVLKSLRLAMTLVSKQKSGRNFQTILADEEDGPLDAEKAQSFVGLYKAILEVGGFDSCFYISHNPEVVAMADHRISFSKEGISID